MKFEVIEDRRVIAVFLNRDDAKLFIDGCGNNRMKIQEGEWAKAK